MKTGVLSKAEEGIWLRPSQSQTEVPQNKYTKKKSNIKVALDLFWKYSLGKFET